MPRTNIYPDVTLFPGTGLFPDEVYPPNSIGQELYDQMAPLVDAFGDIDEDLKIYCFAIGLMLQQVDDISKDGPEGQIGWSQIFDRDLSKDEWLFWMGQLVGYQVPQKASTQTQAAWSALERTRIQSRSAHRRGTIALLREVVQEHLNDPKDVIIQERTSSPHQIAIWIFNNQIATSAALAEAAARAAKAAGLILTFTVLTGANYSLFQASNATYTIALGKHANYNSVLTNPGL